VPGAEVRSDCDSVDELVIAAASGLMSLVRSLPGQSGCRASGRATGAAEQGPALLAGDRVRVVGGDALDVGTMGRFPVAGIAGDHAVVVQKMQIFPAGPLLLSRLHVQNLGRHANRE